jgi:hypothetical protein
MTAADPATNDARATVREVPLDPHGEVSVMLITGSVRLVGHEAPLVRVATLDGEALDDAITIETGPDGITITPREAGIRLGPLMIGRGRSVDLDVAVPRLAAVTVRTTSGDVTAHGLAGPTRWTTVSGDLSLDLDGGPVTIGTASGDAEIRAGAPITLDARTVSGSVRVRAPRLLGVRVETTSGDVGIEGELDAAGHHAVGTVSGEVRIHTDSPVRLETRSVAGDVEAVVPHRTEGGRGRRTVVVGAGSVAVAVRTMSGDVTLRPARDAAAEPVVAPVAPAPPVPPAPRVAPAPPAHPADTPAPSPTAPAAVPSPTAPVPPEPVEAGPAPTAATSAGETAIDRREAARLDVLRALERGELDVEAAGRRLEALDEAGPRYFRGWV